MTRENATAANASSDTELEELQKRLNRALDQTGLLGQPIYAAFAAQLAEDANKRRGVLGLFRKSPELAAPLPPELNEEQGWCSIDITADYLGLNIQLWLPDIAVIVLSPRCNDRSVTKRFRERLQQQITVRFGPSPFYLKLGDTHFRLKVL